MKKIIACIVSLLACSMMTISAYAINNVSSLPNDNDIDVRGMYVGKFKNVSVGTINGDPLSVGDRSVKISSEADNDQERYAINQIFSDNDAFSYVKEKSGANVFDAYYINFIDDEDGKLSDSVKIELSNYNDQYSYKVYFIDSEGNKTLIPLKIDNSSLSASIDKTGFVVIESSANDSSSGSSDSNTSSNTDSSQGQNDNSSSNGNSGGNVDYKPTIGGISIDRPSTTGTNPNNGSGNTANNTPPADHEDTSIVNSSNDQNKNTITPPNQPDNTDSSNSGASNNDNNESPKTGVTVGLSAGVLLAGVLLSGAILVFLGKNKDNKDD